MSAGPTLSLFPSPTPVHDPQNALQYARELAARRQAVQRNPPPPPPDISSTERSRLRHGSLRSSSIYDDTPVRNVRPSAAFRASSIYEESPAIIAQEQVRSAPRVSHPPPAGYALMDLSSCTTAINTPMDSRAATPDITIEPQQNRASESTVRQHRLSGTTVADPNPRNSRAASIFASKVSKASVETKAIRSIFPTFDENRKLEEQYYFPSQMSPREIPWTSIVKAPYSPDCIGIQSPEILKSPSKANAGEISGRMPLHTQEHELPALWDLATGHPNPDLPSCFRLQMFRRAASKKGDWLLKRTRGFTQASLLNFGVSQTKSFYSVNTTDAGFTGTRVQVRRFNASKNRWADSATSVDANVLACSFSLPPSNGNSLQNVHSRRHSLDTVNGVGSVRNDRESSEDQHIATLTPHRSIVDTYLTSQPTLNRPPSDFSALSTSSKVAARAMGQARVQHACVVAFVAEHVNVRTGMRGGYILQHPAFTSMDIEVDGDVRLDSKSENINEASNYSLKRPANVKIYAQNSRKRSLEESTAECESTTGSYFSQPSSPAPTERTFRQGEAPLSPASNIRSPCASTIRSPTTSMLSPAPLSASPETLRITEAPSRELLASLDANSGDLFLHTDALQSLNDPYIVDTIVSAITAVVLSETTNPRLSHLTCFAAPPTRAVDARGMKSPLSPKGIVAKVTGRGKKEEKKSMASNAEDSLATAMGAAVFVLGAAVEGLAGLVEKAKEREREQHGQMVQEMAQPLPWEK